MRIYWRLVSLCTEVVCRRMGYAEKGDGGLGNVVCCLSPMHLVEMNLVESHRIERLHATIGLAVYLSINNELQHAHDRHPTTILGTLPFPEFPPPHAVRCNTRRLT